MSLASLAVAVPLAQQALSQAPEGSTFMDLHDRVFAQWPSDTATVVWSVLTEIATNQLLRLAPGTNEILSCSDDAFEAFSAFCA
jgi:hypothetical protein